jgi:hypothetical protein
MTALINLDKYINFKFIELSELKGKVIKDVFNNQYDNFSFIVTEDNELSGYELKCFPDSTEINDEGFHYQIYPLDFNDVVNFIVANPYDYSFEINNLIIDPEGLDKEIRKIEEQQEKERQNSLKEQRYNQYLQLKKEFENK